MRCHLHTALPKKANTDFAGNEESEMMFVEIIKFLDSLGVREAVFELEPSSIFFEFF